MDEGCPLCRLYSKREIITELYWEDDVCIIVDCSAHKDKKLIVIKRHSPLPSPEEAERVQELIEKLFPGKVFRSPASLREHWHWHEA